MSSFVAHGLAGMTAWGWFRRSPAGREYPGRGWFPAAAAVSILPDIDSLIGLEHRGVTHTIGFALACGTVVASASLLRRKKPSNDPPPADVRRPWIWLGLVFAGATWLHPLMDLLTNCLGGDMRLFWPFWDRYIECVDGGLPLHNYTTNWRYLPKLFLDGLHLLWPELLIFIPLFAASLIRHRIACSITACVGLAAWVYRIV